jgi:DNA repair exonuclease SbcCD nuclease subunit
MSVTLVWRSDVHLADQPPQSRTDNWAETLLGKLEQVGEVAKRVKAQAVLDGGDFFHIKSPGRNTHALVRQVALLHKGYSCPVYGNVGNHDVKWGNKDYLEESPLGVLFDSGVFHRLYDEHEAVFTSKGVTVRVVGIPYHGTQYDMNRFTTITKGEEDYLVVMAHCLASPKGGTMFEAEDIISYNDLANLDPDVWCFGHWHKDQGVIEYGSKWIVNVGSLSRGSIAVDDLARTPSCAVLTFTKEEIKVVSVPLEVEPVEAVFDLDRRDRETSRKETVETLVENILKTLGTKQSASLLNEVRSMPEISELVRERTISYLEIVGAS